MVNKEQSLEVTQVDVLQSIGVDCVFEQESRATDVDDMDIFYIVYLFDHI